DCRPPPGSPDESAATPPPTSIRTPAARPPPADASKHSLLPPYPLRQPLLPQSVVGNRRRQSPVPAMSDVPSRCGMKLLVWIGIAMMLWWGGLWFGIKLAVGA